METTDLIGTTIANGEMRFGPNARMAYINAFGDKIPIVWSPTPTGTDSGNIEMLVEARMRIDRELKEAGVTLTAGTHGTTWKRA